MPASQPQTIGKRNGQKETQEQVRIPLSLRTLRLPAKKRLDFYDQMATLIDSGITLIESLYLIHAQTKEKRVKELFREMIHRINTGMSLAETMYLFPHIFPGIQTALVEAGEKSGNLNEILAELAKGMESDMEFLRKIKSAMYYPVILVILAVSLVTGMMIFVIPKIQKMYSDANVKLPALTQKIIDISTFVSQKWAVLFLVIILAALGFWFVFFRTRPGRLIWEEAISKIPVVGKLNKEKNLMVIASGMGMLLRSGVLIGDAFAITEKTIRNIHYSRALAKIRKGVIMGTEVSKMMGLEDIKTNKYTEHKLFPLQVAQMIHIGETTGRISEMMLKIKKNYHKSIDYTLKNVSTIIEPVMILIVAVLVGSILLAVMLPFFYLGTTIN